MNLEQQREALAEIGERLDEVIVELDQGFLLSADLRHAANTLAIAHAEINRAIMRNDLLARREGGLTNA